MSEPDYRRRTLEKQKKATKGQRDRIKNMLNSGLIGRDEAQALIEKHREASSDKKSERTKDVDEKLLAFWEGRFPGKGAVLIEILGPFYDWKPELKPALSDVQERARAAIFWRGFNDVKVFRLCEAASLRASIHPSYMMASTGELVSNSLMASLDGSFKASVREKMRKTLRDSLWASLYEILGARLVESLQFTLWALLTDTLENHLGDDLLYRIRVLFWDSIGETLACALQASLHLSLGYSCGFAVAGKSEEAAKFKLLLEMWLAGNLPVGFDKEGNLLVLVA